MRDRAGTLRKKTKLSKLSHEGSPYLAGLHGGRLAIEHVHGLHAALQHANSTVEHALQVAGDTRRAGAR